MNKLDLPKFDVPELPDKEISLDVYDEWNSRHARYLAETGQIDRLRRDPSRTPVSVRFSLR